MYTKEVWTGNARKFISYQLRAKRAGNANYTRLQVSAAKWMRTALVWAIMQRLVVISAHFVISQNTAVVTCSVIY